MEGIRKNQNYKDGRWSWHKLGGNIEIISRQVNSSSQIQKFVVQVFFATLKNKVINIFKFLKI